MAELPVILLPVGHDDDALDACLAALDAGTPAGTRIWLADDARIGPRGAQIVQRWLQSTPLQADYTCRQRSIGEVAHLDDVLRACGDADVIVLAPDAMPAPGWAAALARCFAGDASIATATPWCNAGEAAAWPRIGEINPVQADAARLARACQALPALYPELPAAIGHAVLLRGNARRKAGGLDVSSYRSWYAALIDLSLRMAGLGWRNALCETAFVARGGEGGPADGDMDALAARWPSWHSRLATFLMQDPLHATRLALQRGFDALEHAPAQQQLFQQDTPEAVHPPASLSHADGGRTTREADTGERASGTRDAETGTVLTPAQRSPVRAGTPVHPADGGAGEPPVRGTHVDARAADNVASAADMPPK